MCRLSPVHQRRLRSDPRPCPHRTMTVTTAMMMTTWTIAMMTMTTAMTMMMRMMTVTTMIERAAVCASRERRPAGGCAPVHDEM